MQTQEQTSKLTAVGHSLQFASYAALCALADQTLTSNGEKLKPQRHPTISSFESEKEMIAYTKALYAKLQAAIKLNAPDQAQLVSLTEPRLQPENTTQAQQRSAFVTVAGSTLMDSLPVAAAKSKLRLTRANSAPASAITAAKGEDDEKTDMSKVEKATTLMSRLLPTTQVLLPGQEDEFQAIARILLTSPALLKPYHIDPSEEFDSAFSQIDP